LKKWHVQILPQTTTVSGCQLSWFLSKQLRTICSRLAIKGIKNIKKSKMVYKIVISYWSRQVYNKITRQQNEGNNNNTSTQHHTQATKGSTMLLSNYQFLYSLMPLPSTLPPLATMQTRICLIADGLETINYFGFAISTCLSNLIQRT
jgi:hypothetical protein